MSATDLPLRLRVGPDVLSVVVSAYAAMIEALGPLWTCQAFPVGPASVCDVPTVRPILHGLTVRWTDHARSGGGVYVGWDADVAGEHGVAPVKLSEVGNGMLFPPSWYSSPPDVPEPDEVDLWPWEDERDLLAERGAYDRDDECPVCGAPLDGACCACCSAAKVGR